MIDMIDRRILLEISDDLNIHEDIFGEISGRVGISKDELLNRLTRMQNEGILKRISPVIKHYNAGYVANAMVVWDIEDNERQMIEKLAKSNENISHVYERERRENWPYNLYTMIHGQNAEEVTHIVDELSRKIGNKAYRILYTKKQWKKTSPDMKYYLSAE
ncbi:DNA-binding Lrp family transcriptional regulator [Anaerosolibacter carboniphilus]|uniref:DNA-binding Lrp family transcriptional regulator n=1 Tax=Anaerosolibacter carboniphilus TaxID=1417629 RepID=A0A841KXW9_9FIRM|nr:Lrp/AsnC family transcriptional regulator [Anaerosolibacter carboniphilus]MBB6214985.1 DNA-binding Lrp family transcriptional regulator [Anaerosolibacter carboniphilus]